MFGSLSVCVCVFVFNRNDNRRVSSLLLVPLVSLLSLNMLLCNGVSCRVVSVDFIVKHLAESEIKD